MNENDTNDKIFPKSFYWGGSTAGHQVEGGNVNQWSVWEHANAKQLAHTASQRLGNLSNWNDIKKYAEDPDNYISGKGIEHYQRYEEDFDLVKKMNMNAFRFSIEWSRIEPKEGEWDEKAVEHYKTYIAELRARHIEPIANIWHWTMPTWFTDKGGFKKRANINYFERFVSKIAEDLTDDLSYIITLNEPNVYTTFGYVTGEWVPQEKSIIVSASRVYFNLLKAHKKAYKILKKQKPTLQIGLAMQLANIQAKRPHNFIDTTTTKWMRFYWNWWFLNRSRNQQDFVGINYYFSDYYKGFWRDNPRVPLNDLGWFMEPEGLYPLLLRVWAHYKKPIIITENGVADEKDDYRRWWLEETIVAMQKAISEGVDLRGYLHWSLMDNFEWKYGWWPKFGLIEVDRKTMKRIIRPSGKWFAERIKNISES